MRFVLVFACLLAPAAATAEDWGPVQFLLGQWTGEGGGAPGQATGGFSFVPDLQGKVLIRKNFAEYPPAGGKPAFRHDDLMVIYREEDSPQLRAIYFDNEGHVIHYSVRPIADGGVVMESEGPRTAARYRMTYRNADRGRLKIRFEIAPPGKDFAGYIEATARRDGGEAPK